MGKLVLGIIVIACLDVAFIGYTFIEGILRKEAVVAAVETGADKHHDLGWIDELARSPLTVDPQANGTEIAHRATAVPFAAAMSRKNAEPDIRQATRYRSRSSGSVPTPDGYGLSPASGVRILRESNNTLILYRRSPPACERQPAPATPTQYTAENRKPSYLARVLPAFKKPWNWVKAIPSKLR